MAARAIWKGVLHVGDISVPVKLYGAVADKAIHFRLLHAKDRVPVRQEMVRPDTGEVVPAEAIYHGYETDDGRMVLLTASELKSLEPAPSRRIEVIGFLPREAIDRAWYEHPYFLGPDGDRESYLALAAALESAGSEGLARWAMRGREYFGVLRLQQHYPVLITLRHREEVVQPEELKIPGGRAVDRRDLAMAEQLVAAMADTFEPARFRDGYRGRVLGLIAGKASGKIVPIRKAKRKETTRDLQKALAGSLRKAGRSRRG